MLSTIRNIYLAAKALSPVATVGMTLSVAIVLSLALGGLVDGESSVLSLVAAVDILIFAVPLLVKAKAISKLAMEYAEQDAVGAA